MGSPDNNKMSEIVDRVRSWIPQRMESSNMSRDFWMPDQSCRVCYECDCQFTIFNRRHHCRLCGRVFCAKCTANFIPAQSDEPKTSREDWDRIRVCNYCFKQWEQGMGTVDSGMNASSPCISPSPSATSLISTHSSCTCNSGSSIGSVPYSTGLYQHVPHDSGESNPMDEARVGDLQMTYPGRTDSTDARDPFPDPFGSGNRSDDDEEDYNIYRLHSEPCQFSSDDVFYGAGNCYDVNQNYEQENVESEMAKSESSSTKSKLLPENEEGYTSEVAKNIDQDASGVSNGGADAVSPRYDVKGTDQLDFEENGILWLPPEPEDEEDEQEALSFDDDDDTGDGASGEWGYVQSSNSFGGSKHCSREKSSDEHRKTMKNLLDGHFRALISQLLQIENLSVSQEDSRESWLEIITSLSWEAATLLKPDMSKSGGMDPGGYVKVKCIACGRRSQSMVIKGVVCKKNVAHRQMTSKIDKPRLVIIGGALEYQRVANHLSSFDTLLQQEMDHLKMAVAKIAAHHPNVLLVEKSVSRFAQEYLLAKDISLVLNIKRPLLERIARCTGSQIVPSVDHLTTQKLGYCDSFYVEKFVEEHGSAAQGGKKLTKTLMFFDGCPRPLGCTILLKGANGDELKKVKHVVHYGVFAAYHLALETSFLADEGASLPELLSKSPIKVALPDKPSGIDRSISTIPGFNDSVAGRPPQGVQTFGSISDSALVSNSLHISEMKSSLSKDHSSAQISPKYMNSVTPVWPLRNDLSDLQQGELYNYHAVEQKEKNRAPLSESCVMKTSDISNCKVDSGLIPDCFSNSEPMQNGNCSQHSDDRLLLGNSTTSKIMTEDHDTNCYQNDMASHKEEYPPSTTDHQSILVSLITRCEWKRTLCERHLFRIKYYGSFDKPLGRFLLDHLFDQDYRCRSCEMPPEAHIHCYTNQQGSLTISVRKLHELLLPGEREGKIWMWHRCLRCPRANGFPPTTRRVVMSDAAWGLSFGKFLELSFSNHAAASKIASCGHSLHRDCLRFYGFGKMVACFRYEPVVIHSVYLPPSKLEFNYDSQDWIQREADEIRSRAEILFAEVVKSLHQISEKIPCENGEFRVPTSFCPIGELELEWMLQKEKKEFEEFLCQVLNRRVKAGQPAIDILDINRLKRQLIFYCYMWDCRFTSILRNYSFQDRSSMTPKGKENTTSSGEKPAEMATASRPAKGFSSCDSFLVKLKPDTNFSQGGNEVICSLDQNGTDRFLRNSRDAEVGEPSGRNINHQSITESSRTVRQGVHSGGQFPVVGTLSETLDVAWTGETHPGSTASKGNVSLPPDTVVNDASTITGSMANQGVHTIESGQCVVDLPYSFTPPSLTRPESMENSSSWVWMDFSSFYHSLNKHSPENLDKLDKISEYTPVYILSFRELLHQGGARFLVPVGINDTVIPVYDDEPTSIISYALVSPDYRNQLSNESKKPKDSLGPSASLPILDAVNLLSLPSFDEHASEAKKGPGSIDESILSVSGSRSSSASDPFVYRNTMHARVSFSENGLLGKVKHTVTCYFAKRFEALRRTCCPTELDFIRSLSRCKKWGASGGKSNVFFAKTLDDRFIIKQVTKTELESFFKFAPAYFRYLSESIATGSPTCLAKILGIYQVTSKHLKGGKESKMDVMVMENLLFRRNITRLYDLKGSSRSRYNPDSSGSNKVLLDQNLIETMPTSPIFVGPKAKRLLERAVWNDTSFLASIDVMDYSLLVGMDEEKHELVLGIIDFMRQYTWDKHLETWVKASGFLGGPKNTAPTVISPGQYKKRFRKAMSAYFLMVPDQWSISPIIVAPTSQSDGCEENAEV